MPKVYYIPHDIAVEPGTALSLDGNVLSIGIAGYGSMGVVSVVEGGGITVSNGALSVGLATLLKAGLVRPDGSTITVRNGVISASPPLDTATEQEAVEGTDDTKAMTPFATAAAIAAAVPAAVAADAESRPRWEVRVDSDGNRRLAIVVPGN